MFTLFAALPALYGKGQQEDILSTADELIAEKRYNEALRILSGYGKRGGIEFEQAQARIQRILRARDAYNYTAQLLLDELEKYPIDDARVLALSTELLELDPQRITETQDFINRTREVALFKSNQRRLEEILTQGQDLIARGAYAEALRTYAGGLDIYQADFFRAGYGAAVENRTRQGITVLEGNTGTLTSIAAGLLNAVNDLGAQANQGIEMQNLTAYRNIYNRVGAEMDRLTDLKNLFAGTDTAFREDLTQLRQANPQNRDRNFLAFALMLMEGRADDPRDGMLGVYHSLWDTAVSRARDLMDAKVRSVYTAAVEEAKSFNYSRIGAQAEVLAGYAALPVDLEIRWNRYDTGGQKVTLFNQAVPQGEAENFLRFRSLADSSDHLRTLGRLGNRYTAVGDGDTVAVWRNGGDPEELIRLEQTNFNTLRQIRQEAQALVAAVRQEGAEYHALEDIYPGSGGGAYMDQIGALVSALVDRIAAQEEDSAVRRYTIANGVMENQVLAREQEFQEGLALLEGAKTRDQSEYVSKHPTAAAEILGRMDGLTRANQQDLQNLVDQYNAESGELSAASRVQVLRDSVQGIANRLDTVRSRSRSMAATAQSQSAQAAALRQEGDRYYVEAQGALNQGDYETAMRRVEQAGAAYYQSLVYEDDQATWDKRETALPNLDADIARLLNEEVVRDVRELVAQVDDAYRGGDFDKAEELLTRAENRWKLTQQENNNPELDYWRGMIRIGRRSGRTIPVTAPLYAEMSQLLSEAQRNYTEGRSIIAADRSEGLRKLTLAGQNIQKVRLVYPMNEEAGILDLRIEQVLNPDEFDRNFADRVNKAVAGTKRRDMQSYNDLRNLQKINPRYPNITAIVEQAERDVGLAPPLPDPAAVALSDELTARARPIVTGRVMNEMEGARNDLAQAIRLNPGNQEARRLFDQAAQIQVAGRNILDTEAERLFVQAGAMLNQSNYIGALQLINQIYARNPQYRSNNRVVELERRARINLNQ
ncbi:MAG: hypothetical protein LBP60_00905 [Spirochaetaceae bacterium]|nr:hypothetical protein [Spirochaetaceae bacterium]